MFLISGSLQQQRSRKTRSSLASFVPTPSSVLPRPGREKHRKAHVFPVEEEPRVVAQQRVAEELGLSDVERDHVGNGRAERRAVVGQGAGVQIRRAGGEDSPPRVACLFVLFVVFEC